jgi:hypothetical protein
MVSVGKGRTAMTQARWELETSSSSGIANLPSPPSPVKLFPIDGLTTSTDVTDDELQLANHEEVLHTSSVRSDSMQKIVKTFLLELASAVAPPAN